jgi:hypothetical protein
MHSLAGPARHFSQPLVYKGFVASLQVSTNLQILEIEGLAESTRWPCARNRPYTQRNRNALYLILPWSSRLRNGEAFREAYGDRVGYRYSESEDRGVFWSNDPGRTIDEMARSLGLAETSSEEQARAGDAQDRLRGGPAR